MDSAGIVKKGAEEGQQQAQLSVLKDIKVLLKRSIQEHRGEAQLTTTYKKVS